MKTITHQPNYIDTNNPTIGITLSSVEEPTNQCCICLNNCITKYECSECKKRVKDNNSHSAKMCVDCCMSHLESGYGSNCPICKTNGDWCRDITTNKFIHAKKTIPNIDNDYHYDPEVYTITENELRLRKMINIMATVVYITITSFVLGLSVRSIKGECIFTCANILIDILHSFIVGLIIMGIIYVGLLCLGTCLLFTLALGTQNN